MRRLIIGAVVLSLIFGACGSASVLMEGGTLWGALFILVAVSLAGLLGLSPLLIIVWAIRSRP